MKICLLIFMHNSFSSRSVFQPSLSFYAGSYAKELPMLIITINYNNLSGLRMTVDSVLAQKWREFSAVI